MALSVDAEVKGTAVNNSTVSTAALTTIAADILVVCVGAEWVNSVGASGTVSGIAGGGLTWVKRSNNAVKVDGFGGGGTSSAFGNLEVWWAFSSSAQSGITITATFTKPGSTNFDAAGIVAFGVTGFTGTNYQTNPWDQNAAVPFKTSSVGSSAVNATGITTTNTNTMLIGSALNFSSVAFLSANTVSGYTIIDTAFTNAGAVNDFTEGVEKQVVSATQSNVSVGWTDTLDGWILTGDALSQTGGAVSSLVLKSPLKQYLRR